MCLFETIRKFNMGRNLKKGANLNVVIMPNPSNRLK